MAQRIINVLKAIEVEKQNRNVLFVARRNSDSLGDPVVQEDAVG